MRNITILTLLLIVVGMAHASPYEGVIFDNTENSLGIQSQAQYQNLLQEYFLSDNEPDSKKIKETIIMLEEESKILLDSAYLSEKEKYIDQFNYSNKEASKTAAKRVKKGKTFLFLYEELIEGLNSFLDQMGTRSKAENIKEVSRLAFMLIPLKTFHSENVYTKDIHGLKYLANNFYTFNFKKSKPEATNLLTSDKQDVSLINPPSSSFWVNNKVEEYNPLNENFFKQDLFPRYKDTVFHFKRMGRGSPKLKTYYVKNIDGEAQKVDITLKLGREVHPELLSAHLARAVGYPAKPMAYRESVKLMLGDISFDEFKAKWQASATGFHSFVGRIKYNLDDHSVTLKNVQLEAYPKNSLYKKVGPFRSAYNAFNNRREFRALLGYAALINWSDSQDRNVRVDAFRMDKKSPWQTLYYLNDTGMSMGDWYSVLNPGVVNTYSDNVTFQSKNKVRLKYLQLAQHPDTWQSTNVNDMKWIIRRYARLTPFQIEKMAIASGYPLSIAELYSERIKRRINDLIIAFRLDQEGVALLKTRSYESLSEEFPLLITKAGKLTPKADANNDNTIWYAGERETLGDLVKIGSTNLLQESLDSILELNPELVEKTGKTKLGSYNLTGFIKLGGSREVSVNIYHGTGEERYKVTDKFTVRLPIGMTHDEIKTDGIKLTLPIGVYSNYTYTLERSFSSLKEANLSSFFNRIVPYNFVFTKKDLNNGETLSVRRTIGYNIGGFGVELDDDLVAKIDLSTYKSSVTNEMIFSKFDDTTLEVAVKDIDTKSFTNGINLTAYLRFLFEFGSSKTEFNERFYRFEAPFSNQAEMDDIFGEIFYNSNYELADKNASYRFKKGRTKSKFSQKGFFIWDWNKSSSQSLSQILDQAFSFNLKSLAVKKKSNYNVLNINFQRSFGRDLKYLWNDDTDLGFLTSLAKIGTRAVAEGTQVNANFEVQANEDFSDINQMQLNIEISRKDNWVTRSEFNKDFRKFFAKRANVEENDYFTYRMPKQLKHFSPLEGIMRVQIGKDGIFRLAEKIKGSKYCHKVCKKSLRQFKWNFSKNDPEENKERLTKSLQKLMNALKIVTGNFVKVERVLKYLESDQYWQTAKIKNALEYSISAVIERDVHLFAPEKGKYQGPSFSQEDKFLRSYFLSK